MNVKQESNNPSEPMSQSTPLANNLEKTEEVTEEIILSDSQDSPGTEVESFSDSEDKNEKRDEHTFVHNPIIEEFLKNFEGLKSAEEKVHYAVEFMRNSLSQSGSPYFKGFWEARRICLPFFKEIPNPARSQLWNEYIELTKEGRRLKVLLDEESAFAVEQIEIAIHALEQEISLFETQPDALKDKAPVQFSMESQIIKNKQSLYIEIQEQLNLLNTYASRINALRKELIRTEIRIRQKNKFFQRLSLIGDRVFPKRKDLIREISELFLKDVEFFVEDNFSEQNFSKENIQKSLFFYREEIKALQSIAKVLTLNTHAFSATREQLSFAWDQLKGMEKEVRKEVAQQRAFYRQNVEQIRDKFKEFSERFSQNQLSMNDAFKELEDINQLMRNTTLGKEDVRVLREEFKELRKPLLEQSEKEESVKRQKESELEQERREKNSLIKQRVENLTNAVETKDYEELTQERETLLIELQASTLTKGEKQILERSLKRIRDLIAERKERETVELSEHDRESLDQLKQILVQRKERRNEVKAQIEEYRKLINSSGLDIEKSMMYNELMAGERERLEKINDGIQDIEQKLVELKKKSHA